MGQQADTYDSLSSTLIVQSLPSTSSDFVGLVGVRKRLRVG